jgi:hypothetical protein
MCYALDMFVMQTRIYIISNALRHISNLPLGKYIAFCNAKHIDNR